MVVHVDVFASHLVLIKPCGKVQWYMYRYEGEILENIKFSTGVRVCSVCVRERASLKINQF